MPSLEFDLSFDAVIKNPVKKTVVKPIIANLASTVHGGQVLAILGPSGCGKSTLINAMCLQTPGGNLTGTLKLDGQTMTNEIFNKSCAVMRLKDQHWAFLTCRETMQYAVELYANDLSPEDQTKKVDGMLKTMGLEVCADVKCGNEFMKGLSGGQYRRLSLGLALLKTPKMLFLDEPTTGLDSAAAKNIMEFLTKLARDNDIGVVTALQQPSSSMFEALDQLMVMSQGRAAYVGPTNQSIAYFGSLGHDMPANTNPADFLLDVINHDFCGEEQVLTILNKWQENSKDIEAVTPPASTQVGLGDGASVTAGLFEQIKIMTRRHGILSIRDPTLYLGRALAGLNGGIYFGIIYIRSRERMQDQVYNRQWLNIWYIAPTVQACLVSVYVFNIEFKAILRETKNGMVGPVSYLVSRLLIEIPAFFLMYLIAMLIPQYAVSGYDPSHMGEQMLLWSVGQWSFECFAQLLAVQTANPLLGMLNFINVFFTAFLFAGFLLAEDQMVWPFKIFSYIMPMKYIVRGTLYNDVVDVTYQYCNTTARPAATASMKPACYGVDGETVLQRLSGLLPVYGNNNTTFEDVGYIIIIGLVVKLFYSALVIMGCYKTSKLHAAAPSSKLSRPLSPVQIAKTTAPGSPEATGLAMLRAQSSARLRSHSTTEYNSVFQFKDLSFSVTRKKKNKETGKMEPDTFTIINRLSATVRSGDTLAIMGPSGAGKTTLINALTLNASGGLTTGTVELDGKALTIDEFKRSCFLMGQFDNHWAFLTCLETMQFAAQLFMPDASPKDQERKILKLQKSMGLEACANTKCGNEFMNGLSGGQLRRLSMAIGLLKNPKVFFLDEPTSGLDAASAAKMMELVRSTAEVEKLAIVCTIHQPSSEVYRGFDKLMLLSKGRTAYVGPAHDAQSYFNDMGYPMPENINPADHFLDLVNADFCGVDQVLKILNDWKGKAEAKADVASNQIVERESVSTVGLAKIMFKRHWLLCIRDPVLYIGRGLMYMFGHIFFAVVYIKARERDQEQVINRIWVIIWFHSINSAMGVVAVYAFNSEFVAVRRELRNGMATPITYLVARSILEIPFHFIMSIFALLIPGYIIIELNWESFVPCFVIWSLGNLVYEAWGQIIALQFNNFLLGMMAYIGGVWFNAFLYAGFLLPVEQIPWPFQIFAYLFPMKYGIRSFVYLEFYKSSYPECVGGPPICYGSDGTDVLESANNIIDAIDNKDTVVMDMGILIAFYVAAKLVYAFLLVKRAKEASQVKPASMAVGAAAVTPATPGQL